MKLTIKRLESFMSDRMQGMDYAELGRKYGLSRQNARDKVRYLSTQFPQLHFPDLRNLRYISFMKKMEEKHPDWFKNGKPRR